MRIYFDEDGTWFEPPNGGCVTVSGVACRRASLKNELVTGHFTETKYHHSADGFSGVLSRNGVITMPVREFMRRNGCEPIERAGDVIGFTLPPGSGF